MNGRSRLLPHIALTCVLCWVAATIDVRTQGHTIWFADHEEPGDSDWYSPGGSGFGGGEFDSGCSSAAGSGMAGTTFVKWQDVGVPPPTGGGAFGLMLASVNNCGGPNYTPDYGAGTRMFRWKEPKWDAPNQALQYKVWLYFPQNYLLSGSPDWWFWNVIQWKSTNDSANDVFFSLNIYNRPNGRMFLVLRDAQGCQCNLTPLAILDVPVNQWFYIDAYYDSQELPSGQVKIWQGDSANRTLLYDLSGVRTKYAGGDTAWSVNNYTSGLTPQPAYFFIDNAEIRSLQ